MQDVRREGPIGGRHDEWVSRRWRGADEREDDSTLFVEPFKTTVKRQDINNYNKITKNKNSTAT